MKSVKKIIILSLALLASINNAQATQTTTTETITLNELKKLINNQEYEKVINELLKQKTQKLTSSSKLTNTEKTVIGVRLFGICAIAIAIARTLFIQSPYRLCPYGLFTTKAQKKILKTIENNYTGNCGWYRHYEDPSLIKKHAAECADLLDKCKNNGILDISDLCLHPKIY